MILITTYNRPDLLNLLLQDIEREDKSQKVIILDDGSDVEYHFNTSLNIIYIKQEHKGKERYYETVSYLWSWVKEEQGFIFMLPDDIRLKPYCFTHAIALWDMIGDKNKICLSIGHTHDRIEKPNWTMVQPEELGAIVKTQWNDLCFMAEKSFFKVLEYNVFDVDKIRWRTDKTLGSGVGSQISNRLFRMNYNMYHTTESLVEFPAVESKMHK